MSEEQSHDQPVPPVSSPEDLPSEAPDETAADTEETPQAPPTPTLVPEALLAMAEYHAIEARFQAQSAATRAAAQAALRTWMRRQGLSVDRHYTRTAWTGYYDQMLAYSGH